MDKRCTRRGRIFDAVDQAARGTRVPPRRTVQQPQCRRSQGRQLPARTTELNHRPALHAAVDDRGRRHHVRNRGLVVRPGPAAAIHTRVPRHGRHSHKIPKHRQVPLRLLPRLHPRPLPAGISDGGPRQRDCRTRHLRRHRRLRPSASVDGRVDGAYDEETLRLHHARPLPQHLPHADRLLGLAACRGAYDGAAPGTRRHQLHHIFRPRMDRRAASAAHQGGPRPHVALRHARYPHGRRTRHLLYGRHIDAARIRRLHAPSLVDRIPPQQDVRREGRLAHLLSRSGYAAPRLAASPHPARRPSPARQHTLPHARRHGWLGMGAIPSRRHLHHTLPHGRRPRA